MKIRSLRAELFQADGEADITKITAIFRNFAKAPNNQSVNSVYVND